MADHPRPTRSTQPIPHQPPEEDSLAQDGEPIERSRFANFDAEDGNEEQWQQPTTQPTDLPEFLATHTATQHGWSPTPYTSSNPIPYRAIPMSKLLEHEGSAFEDVPTQAMPQPVLPPVSETNAEGATIFSPVIKQFLAALIEHHEAYREAASAQYNAHWQQVQAAEVAVRYHEQQIESLKQQIANA